MRLFSCQCGATVFFDNTSCLSCGRDLGYLTDRKTMSSLEPGDRAELYCAFASPADAYKKCQNYALENVCNWMVRADAESPFCVACGLNETIPRLDQSDNRVYWAKIEASKRRLLYSLLELGLPIRSKRDDPSRGLAFAFLSNPPATSTDTVATQVMTGHNEGLITINIAEADEVERELTRRRMHEAYRTLLGHFRHESGHYYWNLLVDGSSMLDRFRELFGDERQDYGAALERHYAQGPPPDWQTQFISSYASSHPWEDWAESWAHYLHIVDTLETAESFGMRSRDGAEGLVPQWVGLSMAINSISRSMGMRDLYPFVLGKATASKIELVHEVVLGARANP